MSMFVFFPENHWLEASPVDYKLKCSIICCSVILSNHTLQTQEIPIPVHQDPEQFRKLSGVQRGDAFRNWRSHGLCSQERQLNRNVPEVKVNVVDWNKDWKTVSPSFLFLMIVYNVNECSIKKKCGCHMENPWTSNATKTPCFIRTLSYIM